MEKNPIELKDSDYDLSFLSEDEPEAPVVVKTPYRVLITDDDKEVHAATRLLLKNFKFEGHPLELLHTYSGKEAMDVLAEVRDIALIFLDVVMEESDTGLKVVDYIRKTLGNQKIRIILRTGQPGEAPEEKVIEAYDINDYRLKTEMSATRLFTSVYEALRSYRDLMAIEAHRQGLEQIVKMSSKIFTLGSVEAFYSCMLEQILKFEKEDTSAICFRECKDTGGFVFLDKRSSCNVVAATGKYEYLIGRDVRQVEEIQEVFETAKKLIAEQRNDIISIENGYLIYRNSPYEFKTFIYVEGKAVEQSMDTLKAFLFHYDLALDHFILNQKLSRMNCEIIRSLGVEKAAGYLNTQADPQVSVALMEAFWKQFETP